MHTLLLVQHDGTALTRAILHWAVRCSRGERLTILKHNVLNSRPVAITYGCSSVLDGLISLSSPERCVYGEVSSPQRCNLYTLVTLQIKLEALPRHRRIHTLFNANRQESAVGLSAIAALVKETVK